MIKVENCPICNSPNIKKLKEYTLKFPGEDIDNHLMNFTYTRHWILFEKIIKNRDDVIFNSMLCKSCGFIFTNPTFSENDLKIKYDTISELGAVKEGYGSENDPPFNLDKRADRIYNLIHNYYQLHKAKPKILDYGGASGYNLLPFVKSFKCFILDYEKWDLPEGIEYLGKDLSDLQNNDRFDVILLLHTLEHITHPRKFIEDIIKYLKDDGIIYVEVPLGCFQEWKIHSIRAPLSHINFFSEESLFKYFNLCGLNVIHLTTSYQWVTHHKLWCLNILGTKDKSKGASQIRNVLSTQEQMSKIYYYLPYLFNLRIIRKVFGFVTWRASQRLHSCIRNLIRS